MRQDGQNLTQDIRSGGTPHGCSPTPGESFLAGVLAHLQQLQLYMAGSPTSRQRMQEYGLPQCAPLPCSRAHCRACDSSAEASSPSACAQYQPRSSWSGAPRVWSSGVKRVPLRACPGRSGTFTNIECRVVDGHCSMHVALSALAATAQQLDHVAADIGRQLVWRALEQLGRHPAPALWADR